MRRLILLTSSACLLLTVEAMALMPKPPSGESFTDTVSDRVSLNRGILRRFEELHFALQAPDLEELRLKWPLKESGRRMLSVFESPEVIRAEFDLSRVWTVVPHQAIDVARSNPGVSDEVLAPVSGYAIVVKEEVEGIPPNTYGTAVAIYDPDSRVVITLLHVRPRSDLASAYGATYVFGGEPIGELSAEVPALSDVAESLRHAHVYLLVLAGDNVEIRNPFPHFEGMADTTGPTLDEVYLYDAGAGKQARLVDGPVDLVIKTHDQINGSDQFLPPYKMSYSVADQDGRTLASASDCIFERWFEPVLDSGYLPIFESMYDLLGTFEDASDRNWPQALTPASVSKRYYRFVLNHFRRGRGGDSCELIQPATESAALNISSEISTLRLQLELQDRAGQVQRFERMLSR